jgi:hypothetical protein
MINWLEESSLSKLIVVLIGAMSFISVQYVYISKGAFTYGTFDMMLSFIHSTSALSIFVWMCLAIVGEDKVYYRNKKGKS